MKKLLVAVLSLILVFSCMSLTAFAEESIFDKVPAEGTNYVVVDGSREVLQKLDFEDATLPTMATAWGTRQLATEGAIDGNGSLSISSNDAEYPQLNCGLLGRLAQKGRYYVEFDVKPIVGVYGMAVPVMGGYNASCIAELGLVFTVDGDTVTSVASGVVGGFKDGGYENAQVVAKENGVYHCYFEYVINDSNVGLLTDGNDPHIWFNARATDAANNQILLDNITLGKVTDAKYAKNPINTMTFEEGSLPTMATSFGTRQLETEGAIDGNGSLSISSNDVNYPQMNCAMMTATKQLGRYYVEFDVKPIVGVYGMAVPVFAGYAETCIAELGLVFTWDGTTLTNVAIGHVGGWKDSGYENASVKANANGSYHCYFEYVIDDSNVGLLTDANDPHIWFNARATDAANNQILLDNIVFGSLSAVSAINYYTIDWDVDFEEYELGSNAYGSQPIWGNSATVVDDWFDTKCLSLGGATTAFDWGDVIGGFESRAEEEYLGNKFLKGVGKNYVQMDVGQDNCSMINIWTQGYYTSVQFNGTNWFAEGNVRNFKAVEIESGYRISYYIDLPADQFALEFKINAAGDNGVVYIDNLKVVREDYAPFAQSQATYDLVDTKDVEIAVDLKGQEFVSLTSGGEAVETSKYALADGKLTLDKSLFGTEASYAFVLTTTAGSAQIVVAQNDNRIAATVSCGAITKEYDGTTAVSNATLALGGIADGDEVTVSYTSVAFDSSNVSASKVVFEGIALGGKDAGKYVLAQNTLEVSATITPKQLAVTQPTVTTTKVYDGTPAATLQMGTVSGIVDGDSVTLNAVATYDKADVTASKIAVTYTLEGADAQNYVAPANEEITGATITKKQISAQPTVTKTKVYDGTNAAALQMGTVIGIVDGDSVTLNAVATYDKADVTASKITVTYTLDGADAQNYVAPTNEEITGATITKKQITVVADSKTKVAGESDPELTYTVTGLIGSDKLSGALAREEGEEKGEYTITIGTLSAQNYEIQFTSAKLTVEKASGCRSAIGGIAGVVAVVAIVGLGFAFRKKKEN